MRFVFSLIIVSIVSLRGFSQEGPLKAYAEEHKTFKFCLYPSTLRMINIAQDPNFNEMVNDINKLLVYQLDSTAIASRSYMEVVRGYEDRGFEEYATIYGGDQTLVLMGSDRRNEMVGVYGGPDGSMMFFLDGTIGWQKIPTLMNSFQADSMLDVLQLGKNFNGGNRRDHRRPPTEEELKELDASR